MVRKRRHLRQRRTNNTPSKRSKSRKKKTFKEKFYTSAIWALGLINLVLISSKVSEFFVSPNETAISAVPNRPVRSPESVASRDPVPVASQPMKIEVLNGCGVQGLANKFTEHLRRNGFDVVNVTNFEGGFGLRKTTVLDRVSLSKENALKVGRALGVDERQIQPQLDDSRKLRVTVILGKDYKTLKSYREIQ